MQSWQEGRNWVGKCAQVTGMTASLRIQSSKADSNTWESITRSELKLESVHQESPRSDIFRKRATKPLLNQKHHQKHLTCAKEKKTKHVFVSWIQETLGNTLAACCWVCVVHGDINEFQCLVCSALSGVYNDVTWVWVFRAERISWPVLSTRTCSWRRAILTFCPMAIFTPVTTGTAEQLENTEVKARQKRSLDDIVIPSNDRQIHHLTKLRCVDR